MTSDTIRQKLTKNIPTQIIGIIIEFYCKYDMVHQITKALRMAQFYNNNLFSPK